MLSRAKSPSPMSNNYDFALRHERVKIFARVLKQFDANVVRTVQAMRDVAGSLAEVGQSYHEVAQCVNNTNPRSAMNRPFHAAYHNQIVENYGAELQGAAGVCAGHLKRLREGEEFLAFNTAIHKTVLSQLNEVQTKAKKTCQMGDEVATALRKWTAAKKLVVKKETKYVKLERPISASKRHAVQLEDMQNRRESYETKLRAFDADYENLMQRQLYVAGHTIDDFLDANTNYLMQMLTVLTCLAPHGADAVVRMVDKSQQLGDCIGISLEEQLPSRLRESRSMQGTPVAQSAQTSPARGVSAAAAAALSPPPLSVSGNSPQQATHGPAHNFTGYYRNRQYREKGAEQAPPTARASDGEESAEGLQASGGRDRSGAVTPLTPQPCPQYHHRHTPSANEPDPLPPHPGASPLTTMESPSVALAAITVASPTPQRPAAARRPVLTRTASAATPASASTSPAAALERKKKSQPPTPVANLGARGGSTRVVAQASPPPVTRVNAPLIPGPAAAARAPSTEPFDDRRTARSVHRPPSAPPRRGTPSPMRPMNLLSEMNRAAVATTTTTVAVEEPRRSSQRLFQPVVFSPASTAARAPGTLISARPQGATAPPADADTLSLSSRSLEDSVCDRASSAQRPTTAHPSFDPRCTQAAEEEEAPAATAVAEGRTGHMQAAVPDGWSMTHACEGDVASESGGITGRSHALSTSYTLDSPAYGGPARVGGVASAAAASAAAETQVRHCRPA